MDRNLKVSILQIYGDHPVVPPHRTKNRLRSLHPKRSPIHIQVQSGQVDNRPPPPPPPLRSLDDNEHATVKAWSWRCRLHRTLAAMSLNLLLQSSPLDGLGRVQIQDDGSWRQRGRHAKGNRIPLPQDLHHPRLRTSVPLDEPPEEQTAAYHCWARSLASLATSSPLGSRGRATTRGLLLAGATRRRSLAL